MVFTTLSITPQSRVGNHRLLLLFPSSCRRILIFFGLAPLWRLVFAFFRFFARASLNTDICRRPYLFRKSLPETSTVTLQGHPWVSHILVGFISFLSSSTIKVGWVMSIVSPSQIHHLLLAEAHLQLILALLGSLPLKIHGISPPWHPACSSRTSFFVGWLMLRVAPGIACGCFFLPRPKIKINKPSYWSLITGISFTQWRLSPIISSSLNKMGLFVLG